MPSWHRAAALRPDTPERIPQPAGGGDRNAVPYYRLGNVRITDHFIATMPLRVSALRALGAYGNVFAGESFMDELALSAGADPVEFRLRHLEDARARDVVEAAAAAFGWRGRRAAADRGYGFAFARYKNTAAYVAVAIELEVIRQSGELRVVRAAAACDSGEVVNPKGIQEQIEGGIVQSISWTLYEQVAFDRRGVQSRDWSSYPILRFDAVPERIDLQILNRPGEPFLGSGEAAQGPTAAAIANAFTAVTGTRICELPLVPARVRAALGV